MGEPNVVQMPRKEESKWSDPRFLAAMATLIIGLILNYWSSHSADSARAAKNDSALTAITQQAQEMKNSQARIEGSIQTVANVTTGLQSDVKGLTRELDDMKGDIKYKDARIVALEKAISRMEGRGK